MSGNDFSGYFGFGDWSPSDTERKQEVADEFIRRFLLHTLPGGFHRIRHYGFLANGHRAAKLTRCRQLLRVPPAAATPAPPTDYRERYRQLTGFSLEICPDCGGQMELLGPLPYPGSRKTSARYDTS